MTINNDKKILFITIGNVRHASSRIRVLQYLKHLNHYTIKWIPRVPERNHSSIIHSILFFFHKRFLLVKKYYNLIFKKWDVVFIQKTLINKWALNFLQKNNIPIIFDFDDAIYTGPNVNKRTLLNLKAIINTAKTVIVSSNNLAEFCIKHNIKPLVIPSSVDTDLLYPNRKHTSSIITIGWIGSPWTTKYLYLVKDVFKKLSESHDIKLILIGAKDDFKIEGVNITKYQWSIDKENDYLNLMDIGIMPLTNDIYSEGKGGFKILQYMSVGIPSVVSPIGINNEIIESGVNGYLATSCEDWIKKLGLLISNDKLRAQMGQQARKKVVEKYSVKVNSKKFIEAIES